MIPAAGSHVLMGNIHAPGIFHDTIAPSTGFLTAIALLLVLGAAGKSAQIPLYVWLPADADGFGRVRCIRAKSVVPRKPPASFRRSGWRRGVPIASAPR